MPHGYRTESLLHAAVREELFARFDAEPRQSLADVVIWLREKGYDVPYGTVWMMSRRRRLERLFPIAPRPTRRVAPPAAVSPARAADATPPVQASVVAPIEAPAEPPAQAPPVPMPTGGFVVGAEAAKGSDPKPARSPRQVLADIEIERLDRAHGLSAEQLTDAAVVLRGKALHVMAAEIDRLKGASPDARKGGGGLEGQRAIDIRASEEFHRFLGLDLSREQYAQGNPVHRSEIEVDFTDPKPDDDGPDAPPGDPE